MQSQEQGARSHKVMLTVPGLLHGCNPPGWVLGCGQGQCPSCQHRQRYLSLPHAGTWKWVQLTASHRGQPHVPAQGYSSAAALRIPPQQGQVAALVPSWIAADFLPPR